MKYCDLTDREFEIAVVKKLNQLQEYSERQFSEFRSKINEQKECVTEEVEMLKTPEVLELKNSINEMKNALEIEQMIWKREFTSFKKKSSNRTRLCPSTLPCAFAPRLSSVSAQCPCVPPRPPGDGLDSGRVLGLRLHGLRSCASPLHLHRHRWALAHHLPHHQSCWLVSLLLSSLVWSMAAITADNKDGPIQKYLLIFGTLVSVLIQEMFQFAYYKL